MKRVDFDTLPGLEAALSERARLRAAGRPVPWDAQTDRRLRSIEWAFSWGAPRSANFRVGRDCVVVGGGGGADSRILPYRLRIAQGLPGLDMRRAADRAQYATFRSVAPEEWVRRFVDRDGEWPWRDFRGEPVIPSFLVLDAALPPPDHAAHAHWLDAEAEWVYRLLGGLTPRLLHERLPEDWKRAPPKTSNKTKPKGRAPPPGLFAWVPFEIGLRLFRRPRYSVRGGKVLVPETLFQRALAAHHRATLAAHDAEVFDRLRFRYLEEPRLAGALSRALVAAPPRALASKAANRPLDFAPHALPPCVSRLLQSSHHLKYHERTLLVSVALRARRPETGQPVTLGDVLGLLEPRARLRFAPSAFAAEWRAIASDLRNKANLVSNGKLLLSCETVAAMTTRPVGGVSLCPWAARADAGTIARSYGLADIEDLASLPDAKPAWGCECLCRTLEAGERKEEIKTAAVEAARVLKARRTARQDTPGSFASAAPAPPAPPAFVQLRTVVDVGARLTRLARE
jgi:hypothetical protein